MIYGGKAMLNGVEFYSDDFSATAVRKKDGSIYINKAVYEKSSKKTFLDTLLEIPFIRGIIFDLNMVLANGYWKKALGFGIIATGIMWIALTIIGNIFPAAENFLYSDNDATNANVYTNSVLLGLIIVGAIIFRFIPITRYHGAEHKVYNAFLNGKQLIIDDVRTQSRISDECGTNIAINQIVLLIVGNLIYLPLAVNLLLACSLSYEIAKTTNRIINKIVYPFILIGRLVQAVVTTREPTDEQIEIAISAFLNCIMEGPIVFYKDYEFFCKNDDETSASQSMMYEDSVAD